MTQASPLLARDNQDRGPGHALTIDDGWREVAETALAFVRRFSPPEPALTEMVKNSSGVIVNVASVNAFFQPDAATIDYGAAKAALVNLTKTLSQEFGPHGIRVNAVSPGPVATDLWLGEHGVAETVAKATGVDAATAPPDDHRRHRRVRHRSLHHPGRGRRADRFPGLRPGRKHLRRQLPHRRWPDQDNLKTENPSIERTVGDSCPCMTPKRSRAQGPRYPRPFSSAAPILSG